MHNNYYFLRQLVGALDGRLRDAVVMECFSQTRNELMLSFETHSGAFCIKASVGPEFSCLSFPEKFERARRNSVDLFPQLPGQCYRGAYQYSNERSFSLGFGENFDVLFKMHGNRSNVLLIEAGDVKSLFRSRLQADANVVPQHLDRTIDWSYDHFLQHRERLRETYFTFGKLVWRYLEDQGFASRSAGDQWKSIVAVRTALEQGVYYITQVDELPALSLVPVGNIYATFHDPIEAINAFYRVFVRERTFIAERRRSLTALQQQLARLDAWLVENRKHLDDMRPDSRYRLWADIIMANLDRVPPGSSTVVLNDFSGTPVEIKLKPGVPPQKNAEIYYRKARNQAIEVSYLERQVRDREEQRTAIASRMASTAEAPDLRSLRAVQGKEAVPSVRKEGPALPYREHSMMGFRIWVGRNAQANDRLLQHYAAKNDLWLHARDVPGSHVIVKHHAGKKFPAPVIERAAQLAAFHSRRKNESLCPVIVTPRKYVRKRKGDPAGVVVVEREEVIMVAPAE